MVRHISIYSNNNRAGQPAHQTNKVLTIKQQEIMINKEIKTKAQASKVATEFANDLQEKVDIFDCYKVEKKNDGEEYRVVLTSSKGYVRFSMSCMEYFLEVINAYLVIYKGGINWYIDVFKNADGYEYPAIVVCFRKSNI